MTKAVGILCRWRTIRPHCSKYNPIEHRLFPHVTRAWSGLIFRTLEIAVAGLRRVSTSTGLKLTQAVLEKVYALKRRADHAFRATSSVQFDKRLPAWNYVMQPQP